MFSTLSKFTQRFFNDGFLLNSIALGCGQILISHLSAAQNPCKTLVISDIFLLISVLVTSFRLVATLGNFIFMFLSLGDTLYIHFSCPDRKDERTYQVLFVHVHDLTFFVHKQHPIHF